MTGNGDEAATSVLVVGRQDGPGSAVTSTLEVVKDVVGRQLRVDEALEELAAGAFDCIIVDETDPDLDLPSFMGRAGDDAEGVPVMVLTADRSAGHVVSLLAAGATDVVPTPTDHDTGEMLVHRIRSAVARYRAALGLEFDSSTPHETALRERERRLRAVVENLPLVLFVLDADGTFLLSEGKALDRLGLEAGQIVGDSVYDVYEGSPEVVAQVERALEGETVNEVVSVGELTFETWYRPVRRDGAVDRVIGVSLDVTDEGDRERALRARSEALEHTGHGVTMLDEEGRVYYVNPAMEALTGYQEDELLGETPGRLAADVDGIETPGGMPTADSDSPVRDGPAEVAALFERARAEGIARDELRVERKDGRLIHARVTATTIEGADGTHEGYVIAATDVTDERLQRQRLQVLNRVMRHNLRNDLTVIRGHAARLAEEAPEDLARSAELVRETADGLLDVARKARRVEDSVDQIGTGRVETAGELVPSLIDRLSARYPGATIISDCEGCAEVPVSEHLGVAVEELVENAVEHAGRPDPTVEVSGDEVDGFLRLVVTDDGPGIPPHERLTVERGEETPITHGSGIGLWMVAWVVQQLGGQFSVDALADGAGTKATLSVPPRYVEGEDVDRVSAAPGFSMADHRDGDASERPADGDDPETADDEE